MNSKFLQSLANLSTINTTDRQSWLENAKQGIEFLTDNHKNDKEIILYASGPYLLFHSVLVPYAAVDPPDHEDLARAYIMPDDAWCIQRSYGGGEGYRVYLEPPLSHSGCKSLVGGEKLIFLRSFEGVKQYRPSIEISQKLVHSLRVYYMDERSAFCRLDQHGDIEDIITIHDNGSSDPWQRLHAVSMQANDLARYMALSGTALVTKFDFTRFVSGSFSGWNAEKSETFEAKDLFYSHCVLPTQASYANGHMILRTNLTENDLIEEWKAEEDKTTKQYASFKIFDRKNNCLKETSCGPDSIVNYFTKSDLPWEISPAFFRPAVLQKYKADPEKYTIDDRSISCRGSWYLKS